MWALFYMQKERRNVATIFVGIREKRGWQEEIIHTEKKRINRKIHFLCLIMIEERNYEFLIIFSVFVELQWV